MVSPWRSALKQKNSGKRSNMSTHWGSSIAGMSLNLDRNVPPESEVLAEFHRFHDDGATRDKDI